MSFPSHDTYSVGELCEELRELLTRALPGVWVAGETQRVRKSQRGHLYLELIEKGAGDRVVGKLEAVIWRRDLQAVNRELAKSEQKIEEGQQIRCWCEVDFYPPFGRLQLVVRRVDPLFTLGLLEKRRRETLEALAKAGLLELNKTRPLSPVPLRLALITSKDSAAYHDFLATLHESGYGFEVAFLHTAVQGAEAEREVSAALAAVERLDVDCAVLIRGGGSRADLAAFDSRRIAEAVARSPVPVITGLGHEIDEAIADRVAHTATKTPTRAGEFLVQRLATAERHLENLRRGLRRAALEPLRDASRRLSGAERGLALARFRVASERQRLAVLSGRLNRAAGQRLALEKRGLEALGARLARAPVRSLKAGGRRAPEAARRIATAASARLREAETRIAGWGRLLGGLAPERTLARGFSITRDPEGRLVRDAGAVEVGDALSTELSSGIILSRVVPRR